MDMTTANGSERKAPDQLHLRAMRLMRHKRGSREKIFPELDEALTVIDHMRSAGCIIVLVMGTWDLIHRGHGDYIEKGKEEAAKLYPQAEEVIVVAAVDSDKLTRERKGEGRPVVDEEERCIMISHIEWADIVVLEHELGHLPTRIPHDVRVISTTTSDLEVGENVTNYCEQVVNLPPQAETSTSARIRLLILGGSKEVLVAFREGVEKLIAEVEESLNV
jgi:cytidyltransferase-like protein